MSDTPVTKRRLSSAIAELMPGIMRGVRLDFFVQKGVTQTQFVVLAAILAGRRSTMGALAKSLHVRMPTMTGIVDRLVRAGYVRRSTDPHDRRQVAVEVTPGDPEVFFHAQRRKNAASLGHQTHSHAHRFE